MHARHVASQRLSHVGEVQGLAAGPVADLCAGVATSMSQPLGLTPEGRTLRNLARGSGEADAAGQSPGLWAGSDGRGCRGERMSLFLRAECVGPVVCISALGVVGILGRRRPCRSTTAPEAAAAKTDLELRLRARVRRHRRRRGRGRLVLLHRRQFDSWPVALPVASRLRGPVCAVLLRRRYWTKGGAACAGETEASREAGAGCAGCRGGGKACLDVCRRRKFCGFEFENGAA